MTGELRSHTLQGVAKKKRQKGKKERDREESEALSGKKGNRTVFFSLRQEEEKISEGLEASK